MAKKTPTRKRKPAARRPAAAACPPEVLERILVSILAGKTETAIARELDGLAADQVAAAIKTARGRINHAAAHDPDYELGRQRLRFDDLYRRALAAGDNKTALAAASAIGRLLALERPATAATATQTTSAELEAIRGHLAALGLGTEKTTTPELARLAVLRLTELEAGRDAQT